MAEKLGYLAGAGGGEAATVQRGDLPSTGVGGVGGLDVLGPAARALR